jgi:hypothetical protein
LDQNYHPKSKTRTLFRGTVPLKSSFFSKNFLLQKFGNGKRLYRPGSESGFFKGQSRNRFKIVRDTGSETHLFYITKSSWSSCRYIRQLYFLKFSICCVSVPKKHLSFFLFARIVCDVPCSGDGTLRKNPNVWDNWHPGTK